MKRTACLILLAALLLFTGCVRKTMNELGAGEAFWWQDESSALQKEAAFYYPLSFMPIEENEPTINDYHYSVRHMLLDDSIQLFIDCTYSPEDYRKEVLRLNSFKSGKFGSRGDQATWNYTEYTVEYDEGFNYPAIVSVYFDEEGCMYALLDEPANRIVYVCFQFENINNILFDREYLPLDENGEPTTLYKLPF